MHISIDLGGTWGRVYVFRDLTSTKYLAVEKFAMSKHSEDNPGDYSRDMINVEIAIDMLLSRYGGPDKLETISISLAGKLDRDRSKLVFAGSIKHFEGQLVARQLYMRYRRPVRLCNDAEALALCEDAYGYPENGYPGVNYIVMTWSTGIGGAAAYYSPNGELVIVPGEFGHVLVDHTSQLACAGCPDNPGHLEALAGGNNMPLRFGLQGPEMTDNQWRRVADDMITGLKSILSVHPVSLLVLSGGVIENRPFLVDYLTDGLRQKRYGMPEIRLSCHGIRTPVAVGAMLSTLSSLPAAA